MSSVIVPMVVKLHSKSSLVLLKMLKYRKISLCHVEMVLNVSTVHVHELSGEKNAHQSISAFTYVIVFQNNFYIFFFLKTGNVVFLSIP